MFERASDILRQSGTLSLCGDAASHGSPGLFGLRILRGVAASQFMQVQSEVLQAFHIQFPSTTQPISSNLAYLDRLHRTSFRVFVVVSDSHIHQLSMTWEQVQDGRPCRISLLKAVSISTQSYARHSVDGTVLTEEGVVQGDGINVPHCWVFEKVRIDVEEDRHIHCFPFVQTLFFEAKALDLAEVWRNLRRRNTVRGHSDYILIFTLVRCRVECQCCLPGQDSHFSLLRSKLPRQNV